MSTYSDFSDRLDRIAAAAHRVETDLGDLADKLLPYVGIGTLKPCLELTAGHVELLSGSHWHLAVERLISYYGPAFITRDDRSADATWDDVDGVRLVVRAWMRATSSYDKQAMSLEEVVA